MPIGTETLDALPSAAPAGAAGRAGIARRLAFAFGLIGLIVAALAVASHWVIRALDNGLEDIVVTRYPRTELVRDLLDELAAISTASRDALLVGEGAGVARELSRIGEGRARIGALMEQLDSRFKGRSEALPAQYEAVHAASSPYLIGLVKLGRALQAEERDAAMALLNGPLRAAQEDYGRALQALKAFDGARMRAEQERASETSRLARHAILILLGVALVSALAIGTLCTRALTAPLREAVGAASRISRGDLAVVARVTRDDETGQLLRALNDMTRSLSGIVGRVRSVAETVEDASRQIGGASATLSSRAEEQASGFDRMSEGMRDLENMVRGIAQSSQQADELAKRMHEVSRGAGRAMAGAVGSMEEASAGTARIDEIISLIDGLAFQTNILALNAAVESARAGEHGRGFAVVAAEVRALAQRSAAAAKDVRGLVTGSTMKIGTANELLGAAGAAVEEVQKAAREMSELIERVSHAAQAHTAAVSEFTRGMGQMQEITGHNAEAARQTDEAAHALHGQSADLADAIRVFRLQGR